MSSSESQEITHMISLITSQNMLMGVSMSRKKQTRME